MTREEEVIRALTSRLARSDRQLNAPFAADAEVVRTASGLLAVTTDGFSAEDRLPAGDARLLGWNLVIATVSDLLAVGARPEFMLNALVVADFMAVPWLEAFASGLQEALSASGASMLGGDVGAGREWHFTGTALGRFPEGRSPIGRTAAAGEGAVMATGAFGDGNLAALEACPRLRFESRLEASALLPPGAACTDTSDGLARALEVLAGMNPSLQVRLDLDAVPYAAGVAEAAAAAGIPRESFLLASAGEYELVALVPAPEVAGIEATGLWRRIGGFGRAADGGLRYVGGAGAGQVAHARLPDPRGGPGFAAYRDEVVALARRLFGPKGAP